MQDADLTRLPALSRRLAAIDRGEMLTKDGEARETTAAWRASFAEQIASIISGLNDTTLVAAYQREDGKRDHPEAAALLVEIERRGIAI